MEEATQGKNAMERVFEITELVTHILSFCTEARTMGVVSKVCRKWRSIIHDRQLKRHLRIVRVPPPEIAVVPGGAVVAGGDVVDEDLQQVRLNFTEDLDEKRQYLYDQNYVTEGRLNLVINRDDPGLYISALLTSKWAERSNVVRLELNTCLKMSGWSQIGPIILKAFRKSLEQVVVKLTEKSDERCDFFPPWHSKWKPLRFRELEGEWNQREQQEKAMAEDRKQPPPEFRCTKLREFQTEYFFKYTHAKVTDPEVETLLKAGPRVIFELCPNLEKFKTIWSAYGSNNQIGRICNATFWKSKIENPIAAQENYWNAVIINEEWDEFRSDGLKPNILLEHYVTDLLTAQKTLPLRKLTISGKPNVLPILIENPSICEHLEVFKFENFVKYTENGFERKREIEYLTTTTDLKNIRSLYWALKLFAKKQLAGLNFQFQQPNEQDPPLFPNLAIFWLNRERTSQWLHSHGPLNEGFLVEDWISNNYHKLAPNIRRFIVTVYIKTAGSDESFKTPDDFQHALNLASSFPSLQELVVIVPHEFATPFNQHKLIPEKAIPCLKGIKCLPLAMVTPKLMAEYARFFIKACKPMDKPSKNPAVNTTIRKIMLYKHPDLFSQRRRYYEWPTLRVEDLKVEIPHGLVVESEEWTDSVKQQILEEPPTAPDN